jgi:hypothetical protein
MNCMEQLGRMGLSLLLIGACTGCASGDRHSTNKEVAQGETSQQKSQRVSASREAAPRT